MLTNPHPSKKNFSIRIISITLMLLLLPLLFSYGDTPTAKAAGAITGIAFHDYDADGTRDGSEPGIVNITATAYDAAGVTQGSATTAADGTYTLNATGTGPYRIEFTGWPTYLQPSAVGTDSASSVQFVPDGNSSNIDFSLLNPAKYNDGTGIVVVPVMHSGASVTKTDDGTEYGYISFPYSATGDVTGAGDINVPDPTKDTDLAETGTVWGAAYQRQSGYIFAGAFLKRYQGLGPLVRPATGSGEQAVPVDGIYILDYGTTVGGTSLGGFTLNGVVPSAGNAGAIDTGTVTREIINGAVGAADPNALSTSSAESYDVDSFNKIGTIGFGDVDFEEDDETLWILNLNQKSLIRIDASSPATLPTSGAISGSLVSHYSIDFSSLPACNGEYRPWALSFEKGMGYVGVVCDGASSGANHEVFAYVLEFDPATVSSFTSVLDFSLEPTQLIREASQYNTGSGTCSLGTQAGWNRWATSWADLGLNSGTEQSCPQPILSDITFAENGDMILGFIDRSSLQVDYRNYGASTASTSLYTIDSGGDTIHVCNTASGFVVEGFAGCVVDNDGLSAGRLLTDDGPNGAGEFYFNDFSAEFQDDPANVRHAENNHGSTFVLPGTNQVLVNGYDAIGGDFNQGFLWYQTRPVDGVIGSPAPGDLVNQYQVSINYGENLTKGLALGDIEMLLPPAPLEVGNRLWLDADRDGIQDPGEANVAAGVDVVLTCGLESATVQTNANGDYLFTDVIWAAANGGNNIPRQTSCTISIDPADVGGVPTTANASSGIGDGNDDIRDSDGVLVGANVEVTFTTGKAGENNHTYDFGFVLPVSIGSYVWLDEDGDGTQDAAEANIAGATVSLWVDDGTGTFIAATDIGGTAVSNQTTLANGLYNFTNLPPNDYRVRVTPPAGLIPTIPQTTANNNDSEDDSNIASEPIAGTYESGTFSLSIGGEPTEAGTFDGDGQDDASETDGNMTVDFGFIQPVSIGSYIWLDVDGDGTQDASETGIAGATVSLLVDDGTGTFIAATDVDGIAIANQITLADGQYDFTNLPPGDYRVRVTPPAGHAPSTTQTTAANNNSEDDSNIASEPVAGTYESGTFSLTVNGEPTEVGTFDGDDQDDANETDGNMTVDFGFIQPVSIGSFVWLDADNDGIQDASESGFAGATVALLVDDGTGTFIAATDVGGIAVANQITLADGQYDFTNLPPGDYRVRVSPPTGYEPSGTQTTANNNNGEDDSNIASEPVAGTHESGTFTLTVNGEPTEAGTFDGDDQDDANETDGNMTVDFGFFRPVSIGSFVWLDADNDGTQDAAELGIVGATVALLVDDGTGTFIAATDVNGTAVSNQTTLANGEYQFSNLPLGDYRVRVTPPVGNVPSGTQTAGDNNNGEDDSNIASEPVAGTYESGTFSLNSGAEPTESGTYDGDDQDDSNETDGNMTVDFGFIQPVSIGSYVWLDEDGDGTQDAAEANIAGATVSLWVDDGTGTFIAATDIGGTAVSNQTTLANGLYNFTNLPPGDYRVRVTPPAGHVPTIPQTTANNDDSEDDSNIASEPVSGTYESGTFSLSIGGEPTETGAYDGDGQDDASETDGNMTVDFGFIQPVSIGSYIWLDVDGDGTQDASETGIAGATVALLADDGTGTFVAATDVDGIAIANQTTLADGQYQFSNLPPGDYRVRVTPPAGHAPSTTQTTAANNNGEDDSNIASEPVAGTHESGTFTLTVNGEPTETGTFDGDDQDDANETDGNMTVDFGFIQPVSIGSFIWEDSDNDGTQDAAETGIAGADVALLVDDGTGTFIAATDVDGTAVSNQTTLADGQYNFTNLPPGDYRVRVTPPATYSPSTTQTTSNNDSGEDDSNIASEPVAGTHESGTFTLTVNGEPTEVGTFDGDDQDDANDTDGNMTVDFGFYQLASLGDLVWEDDDADGVQDPGENGIPNVTVVLYDITNTPVITTTTDPSGIYTFTNLIPGSYSVNFTTPAGYYPSPQDQGGDDTADSDADTSTGQTATTTLVSGENDLTWDAGFYQLASIGDLVWLDSNGNGIQDGLETGIDGITVTLYLSGTGAISTTTTAGGGAYSFTDLTPDDYFVEFTLPSGYYLSPQDQGGDDTADSDANPVTGQTAVTNLISNENDPTWDAGVYQPASIGDYVWDDDNADGIQNGIESGIGGITVTLYLSGTGAITTTTTLADGSYSFTNLPPNDYYVGFTPPVGYAISPAVQGGDPAADSDVLPSYLTPVTTLVSGENDPTWDAGLYQVAGLGNFVWADWNGNGVQDGGEPGIPGVPITLTLSGGAVVSTTVTDGTGLYQFTELPPADYVITFGTPPGYTPTLQDAGGNDTADSDADPTTGDTAVITLPAGTYDPTWDAGFFQPVSIGSYVWLDENGDGLQDAAEANIAGATVSLLVDDGTGTFIAATDITGTAVTNQTTLADGLYFFDNLPPGDYRVRVTPPAGHVPTIPQTTANNDNSEDDSNIASEPVAGTYESGTFSLSNSGEPTETGTFDGDDQDDANETDGNMSVDFGFIQPVSIGSFIWLDEDIDGTQDATEPGIAGATVELLVDDGTGTFVAATDVDGTAVSNQTTLADGLYFFDNLPPGEYRVRVTPPAGHLPSTTQTTADNDNGEDDSNIASEPIVGTHESGTFTLNSNGAPSETGAFAGDDQDDANETDGNMSVDFGFIQPLSIGSFLWGDSDGDGTQDASELGIVGATVELLVDDGTGTFIAAIDISGVAVANQTTLADGLYNFTNLPPGDYRVRVTPPAENVPTLTQTAADNDNGEDDSNIASEPIAGTYESGTFSLAMNGEPSESGSYSGDDQDDANETNGNMTVDFGFIQPLSIGSFIWEDVDGSGTQDVAEPGIAGATVELLVDDGSGTFVPATDVDGTAVSNQTTLADGQYQFNNLPPGDYRVRVTPPAGQVPSATQTTADNNDSEDDSNIASEPIAGTYESGTFTLTVNGEPAESGSYDGDDQDDTNDSDGNMTIDFGFIQPVAIGNIIWIDDGIGGGTELNGIMDGTEQGVPGVIVELYLAGDTPGVDTPLLTTTTNASGEYLFDMIPQGDYVVHIPASEFAYGEPLSSFISSTGNGGDDANDDDADENGIDNADPAANGISSETISANVGAEPTGETGQGSYSGTLTDSSVNMTIDFGFFELLTLGNYVWFDSNEDGIIDSSEFGVSGVIVYLLDGNGDPVLHPVTGQPISTITDNNGFYRFTYLYPGEYQVLVGAENFQAGGALEGYFSTPGAVDPDDNSDSDDNGMDEVEPWVTGIVSQPVQLDYDDEPANNDDSDDNDNTNLTVDLGFVATPTAVELTSFSASSIGNQQVRINWVTESEIDNFGFRLYRSSSSSFAGAAEIHFEATAVPGGSGPGASYSFIDNVPTNGIYYYWLEDIETDGDTAVHGSINVNVSLIFTLFLPMVSGGN